MSNTRAKKMNNDYQLQHRLQRMAMSALLCTSALVAVKPAYASDVRNDKSIVVAMYSAKTSTVKHAQLNSDSLYNLAMKYIDGEGLPKNEEHGISLLKKAAKRGHTKAQYTLGVMHAQEDEEYIALHWLSKAANKGHEDAQFVYNQIMNSDFSVGC